MFNNSKEIIKIKDLTYIYTTIDDEGNEIIEQTDAKQANGLQGVSLSVYEGEFLALVGHNGSGKSTLAKTLNALIVPQSGDVEVFGPENIGVPQPEIVERVKWALSAVKMQDFAKRTPTKMSGGQKQRIAIAGVLALKPKVIVLDESTAMLDPQGRKEVLDTVKRLNKQENITIILITHFMDEVLDADRVIALDGGKIVMEGTPQEIFAQEQKVKQIGLDLPIISNLAHQLNKKGFDLDVNVFDVEKLGDEICQSLSKI